MSNIYIDRSCSTQGYVNAMINAMENSVNRMRYYDETNDTTFLNQSQEWLDVANIYMRQIEVNNNETISV